MLKHAAIAVACNPKHPDFAATLARTLAKNGLKDQAVLYANRAIEPGEDRFSPL
jgi:hypothetical protein